MRAPALLVVLAACGRFGFNPSLRPDAQEDLTGSSTQMRLTFNNAGREALVDVPVLVTLDPNRIDYTALQPDARDLRFVDADRHSVRIDDRHVDHVRSAGAALSRRLRSVPAQTDHGCVARGSGTEMDLDRGHFDCTTPHA
jgi:hypothetical protein